MDINLLIKTISTLLIGGSFIYFFIYFKQKNRNFDRSMDFVFLNVLLPKKDSKEEFEREKDKTNEIRRVVGISEHFFTSLQGVYSDDLKSIWNHQDFLSLEYIALNGEILFYVGCPRDIKELITKQITSFYPEAIVEETDAPKLFKPKTYQETGYLKAVKSYLFPFKNYTHFESSDSINNILNVLAQTSDKGGNSSGIQFMIRPQKSNWQKKTRNYAKDLGEGKSRVSWWNPLSILGKLFQVIVNGSDDDKSPTNNDEGPKENQSQELIKAMEEKSEKFGFETIIRCITSSPEKSMAQVNLKNILNAFSQFSSPSGNGFKKVIYHSKRKLIHNFLWRKFDRSWHPQNKMILSTQELASLYHFPNIRYNDIPSLKWQNYKIVQAPNNVPTEGLFLGNNSYRGKETPIYIKRDDRFRHFYVIGQTGTGKSSIFQSMVRQDMNNGDGLCVIDPHGSLIEDILPFVPRDRINDIIIFDPSDLERPFGLNLLEAETEEEKDMIALDAMNMMIKMFDEEIFGPRIQDYFRNGVLTLMSDPAGGAMTDILKLFTDDAFQKSKVAHVKNPVIKSFWTNQMANTAERERKEIIPYFAAKFGQFYTNGMIRNIIGQTKSSFNFSDVMDQGKILLMNLSKGMTGDFNSKLLGLIIVIKIQTAALRRQKQSKEKRKDFFLYIDEFQNYVTDSIESILSEARKYRLGLNIAHQYMSQIDTSNQRKGLNLKDAVLGNVGTMMCYKIGAQDAEVMAKEFSPNFTDQDLISIDKYKAIMKLSIDTQPSKPFSITPPNPYLEKGDAKLKETLKQISRLSYGRSKKFVEQEIFTRLNI